MKTINLITLGCAKNVVDSEHLAAQINGPWSITFDSDDPADIVIINTCGFINDAKQESIDTILQAAELKQQGKIEQLYVFGCLAQRYADELREQIPEVDDFFGVNDFYDVLRKIGAVYTPELANSRRIITPKHYAYLKIAEGCNWQCGYCAIPLIRGKYKSVPMEQIIDEASKLAKNGVKELIVVAQDTTYYGMDLDGTRQIAPLLTNLCKIEGIEWIRLHYAYPTKFPMDLLDVMAQENKICNYIDIPMQHISDNILSAMRRGIDKKQTYDLIKEIRNRVPNIVLRTTILVGYPNETSEDIEELKHFIREVKFERLGVFTYSQEEGTYSHKELKDNISEQEKQNRLDEIMNLQQDISLQINIERVGTTCKVIVDRQEGEFFIGRSEWESPEVDGEIIITATQGIQIGAFIDVKITKAEMYDLYAEVIE